MEGTKSQKIWEVIIRLVAVIGGIWTLVSIWQFFNPDEAKLVVIGQHRSWELPEVAIQNLNKPQTVWQIDIENKGDEIAKNIKILFPFDGVYILNKEGYNNLERDTTNKNYVWLVKIADLQPSDKASLKIWTSDIDDDYDENKIRIVHDGGTGDINFGVTVFGISALILKNSFILFLITLGIMAFSVLVWVVQSEEKKSKIDPNSSN